MQRWFGFALMVIAQVATASVNTVVHSLLDQQVTLMVPEQQRVWQSVKRVYAQHDQIVTWRQSAGLFWFEQGVLTDDAKQVLTELNNVDQHGLRRLDYRLQHLPDAQQLTTATPEQLARADIDITAGLLAYVRAQSDGRIEPYEVDQSVDNIIDLTVPEVDPVRFMQRLFMQGASKVLAQLEPQHEQYQRLKSAYQFYDALAQQPALPELTIRQTLKAGQPAPMDELALLQRYLQREHFLSADVVVDDYDSLVNAVIDYQARHGLETDGMVGPGTVAALNRPLRNKLQQIAINMDRWRWLPQRMGTKHILVNIPEYRLRLYTKGELDREMDVIVGKQVHPTPVFNDQVTYIAFSPYWNVPRSILMRTLMPRFRQDADYFNTNQYEVIDNGRVLSAQQVQQINRQGSFPYRVRQKPGINNALGQVKFMFPNEHAIYLHDTPARELFSQTRRSFSSGCIRVKEPVDLAQWLLADQPQWTEARIKSAMTQDQPVNVNLPQKVPVYLIYLTTFVDGPDVNKHSQPSPTPVVYFLPDIYQHDEVAKQLLAQDYSVRQ